MSCDDDDDCKCDACATPLCPGDVFCGNCGTKCDSDKTRGFKRKRRFDRGDTVEIDYDLVDKDGNALDLSPPGTKVWFTIKYYLSDADQNALAQVTLAGGGIALRDVASSGHIRVVVPASSTQFLKEGTTKLYYDLQVLDGNGRVTTVEKGLFLVDPDVTKAVS